MYLEELGTFSSPRAADFSGDGVLDIVVGAGRQEFMATDSAVIALDGETGDVLWHVGARDQVFGSAAIHDLTGDGTLDVVIGGRSAELKAIDGATGSAIWEYFPAGDTVAARDFGLYNFYNPQVVGDVDGDGVADLVVSNGGDVLAERDDPYRPPGRLMVVSGEDGRLIASDTMPDGRETYMSAVVADLQGGGDLEIVFGSGGETFGGHLYRTTLADLLKQDISSAVVLAESPNRGFVGPPVLSDITGDGILDIVANAVDGRMLAFDGDDNVPLWSVRVPDTEAYGSIAVGLFTDDDVPDFFASYAMGQWPNLGWSRQLMVDGQTGDVVFTDSLGLYQTSSPVAGDLDADGRDEVMLSVNFEVITSLFQKRFFTMLVQIDFETEEVTQIGNSLNGSNLSSTPWLGDLDADGLLDIVYCNTPDTLHTYVFNGLQISRMVTDISATDPPAWGAYMGNNYDGIFRRKR
jgi:outer membrane protein assembly factor BamB